MAAGEFKARCLQVMEQVRSTGTPVVITKRGKPVAKLLPADPAPEWKPGRLAGRIEILGDIVSAIVPPDEWDSLK